MAYSFYAVRHGKTRGVVTSWNECKEMIDGVKGAEFKGFNNEDEAYEYLETGKVPFTAKATVAKPIEGAVNVYARGLEACDVLDIGMVIEGHEFTHNFFGRVIARDYAKLGNIAAELIAVMTGVQLAKDLGYKSINIVFAYDGVEKWFDGSWAAKGVLQNEYASVLNDLRLGSDLSFTFTKVAGKSGNNGVGLANKLAKNSTVRQQYIELDKILRGTIVAADVPLLSISKGLTV